MSDASLHVYLYTRNTVYTHGSGFDSTSGLSKTCTSRCVFVCVFGLATCVFRFRLIYVCVCVLNRVQAEKIVRPEYNRVCWKGSWKASNQPRADWLQTSSRQQTLPAKRTIKVTTWVKTDAPLFFETLLCGGNGKKSPNFNISFLIVFIYKGLVHTSVKSFMIFGLLVLTISDLWSPRNQ